MIAGTYGYARVSKADDESNNLDTQLLPLAEHGIRSDLDFSGVASGRNLQRTGWQELMTRVQEGDTIVVAFLDRLSRNFGDCLGRPQTAWPTCRPPRLRSRPLTTRVTQPLSAPCNCSYGTRAKVRDMVVAWGGWFLRNPKGSFSNGQFNLARRLMWAMPV